LWPDSRKSCGRELPTTKLGRKRAWVAVGPALQAYKQHIEAAIDPLIHSHGLFDLEFHISHRLYMIGKNEDSCRATIMLCCINKELGGRAKDVIRESEAFRDRPGFVLGTMDYPIEQTNPVRPLAFSGQHTSFIVDSHANSSSDSTLIGVDVFSTSAQSIPTIGRRLCVAQDDLDDFRYSTGGIVIEAHGRLYQVTAGHIFEPRIGTVHPFSTDDDACSFDGQSETDDDEYSIDERRMRRGSLSFRERSSLDLSDHESEDSDSESLDAMSETTQTSLASHHKGKAAAFVESVEIESPAVQVGTSRQESIAQIQPIQLWRVGRAVFLPQTRQSASLDYALIALENVQSRHRINTIFVPAQIGPGPSSVLQVRKVAKVESLMEERRIVSITGTGGFLRGTLMPGATVVSRLDQQIPQNRYTQQKLYLLELDGTVAEGDSGAVVVDATSGDLYGHIVSGCPGTRIAYFVAAEQAFEDFNVRFGGQATIASSENYSQSPVQELGSAQATHNCQNSRNGQGSPGNPKPADSFEQALRTISAPYRGRIDCLAAVKNWNSQVFQAETGPPNRVDGWEEPWIEMTESFDDHNLLFLVDDDDPQERYSTSLRNLRDFCGGASLADLRQGDRKGESVIARYSVLRNHDSPHTVFLTATGLYNSLRSDYHATQRVM
jgi:hypothetical protein